MSVRIDSIGAVLLKKELKEYIKSLEPGDKIKGRIVEVEQGQVTIKATNGQLVKANVASDLRLEDGVFVELQIDDVQDEKIYASLQAVEKKTPDTDNVLKNLLKNIGLQSNQANVEIAKVLMKNNLPVNAESITKIVNLLKNSTILANTSPEGAIGIMSSGQDIRNTDLETLKKIAVTFEADIKKYMTEIEDSSQDNELKTENSLSVKGAEQLFSDKPSIKKNQQGIASNNVVIDETVETESNVDEAGGLNQAQKTAKSSNTNSSTNTSSNIINISDMPEPEITQRFSNSMSSNSTNNTDSENSISSSKTLSSANNANSSNNTDKAQNTNNTSLTGESELSTKPNSTDKASGNINKTTTLVNEDPTATIKKSVIESMKNAEISGNEIKAFDKESIKQQLKMIGITDNPEIEKFIEKTAIILSNLDSTNIEKLTWLASKGIEPTPSNLDALNSHMNQTNKLSNLLDNLTKKLDQYDSPEMSVLKDTLSKIHITPRAVENSENVKDAFKALVKVSESVDLYLSRSGIQDDSIRSILSNMKDNLDFMRQVNQFNNFIQIPIQMNDNKTTAEVYIYKDKSRSKIIDPENATILISLDLPKSGIIESMINLNEKNVNVTFRLEKPAIGALIKLSEKTLSNRLDARGYTLMPLKTIKLDEVFNLMKMEELIGGANIERLHFDLRV